MGIMKPFKAPSLVGKNTLNSRPPPAFDEDRPTKKRRMSDAESSDDDNAESITAAAKVLKKPKTIPKFQPLVSKSVNTVANLNNSSSPGSEAKVNTGQEGYYTVLWCVRVTFISIERF
jgi:hypothetical protein